MSEATASAGASQTETQTATPATAPSEAATTTAATGATEGAGAASTTETTKAPAASGTVLDATDDGKAAATPADWPADWRERMAGDDKAFLNTLKRYSSPLTYAKAGFEAQQKIRSGEVKKPLGAEATAEEIAAFRKENGIPEAPDGYEIKLSEGMVPGEADKPLLDAFKGFAHGKNWTPGQLNEVLDWYYQQQDAQSAQRFQIDTQTKTASEEELRQEWGPEFRPNINAISNFLDGAPEGVKASLMLARAPDGTLLGNNANVLRWLADLSRDAMPGAGLVPAGTSNPAAAIGGEIEQIKRIMANDPQTYWKDEKMQTRYRELLAAQQKAGQQR
ncbi:MAG: hypothetical protein RL328_2164 [Acidobacteriota bacterium]